MKLYLGPLSPNLYSIISVFISRSLEIQCARSYYPLFRVLIQWWALVTAHTMKLEACSPTSNRHNIE